MDIEGASSQTRLPLAAGLSPVTMRLLPGEKPFERVNPIKLGPDDKFAVSVVETDAGDALPIIVTPPRVRYQLSLVGEDPMWRTEAMKMASHEIDTQTRFRVRPGAPIESPRLVIRNHHGSPVRTMTLTTVDDITWSVELAGAAPSLSVMTEGTFELEFVDPVAARRVSVRLAKVIPSLDWGVEYEDGELTFTSDVQGWNAWVWPLSAPWEQARTIEAGGPLPGELVGAGPLAVQLFAPDRFSDLRAPLGPGPRSVTVDAPGSFALEDATPWARLSEFLAGRTDELPNDVEILPTLWDVQAGWLQRRVRVSEDLAKQLRAALTHQPRESVHAMSRSLVPTADRPAQFISSGLVHTAFQQDGDSFDRHSVTPWIAALEIMGEWETLEEGEPRAKQVRKELAAIAGPNVAQTLETGRDSSLETACIDNTTVQIAHMDPAQQAAVLEMFFGGAGVVPGALSDENSRLIAVFDTFKKRHELSELLGDPELMRTAVSVLRRVKSSNRQLYLSARVRFDRLDGVDTDNPDNRWALAPVISMVFALATRMHAHGHLPSLGKLPQAYDGWAQMARLVPDLVTGDIVAADAMVLGVFGPNLID